MSNIGKELYRKSQTDGYSYWTIQFNELTGYTLIHGTVGGSLTRKVLRETTGRMENRYLDKLNDGYSIKPDGMTTQDFLVTLTGIRTDINDRRKPMKAEPYSPGCLQLPLYLQGKINGVRATAEWVVVKGDNLFDPGYEGFSFFSKEGHEYMIPHLATQLNQAVKEDPTLKNRVFDGEIYKFGLTAPAIKGAAVNSNNPNHKNLSFITFDLAEDGNQYARFIRMNMFSNFAFPRVSINDSLQESTKLPSIYQLETFVLVDETDVTKYRDLAIDNGFEGIILRSTTAPYGFGKRVSTMRKFKKEQFGMFNVLNIYPRNSDDGLPLFLLQNDINDDTFECSCDGTHAAQRSVLRNKETYLNKPIPVRYFERTDAGYPFHATVLLSTIV